MEHQLLKTKPKKKKKSLIEALLNFFIIKAKCWYIWYFCDLAYSCFALKILCWLFETFSENVNMITLKHHRLSILYVLTMLIVTLIQKDASGGKLPFTGLGPYFKTSSEWSWRKGAFVLHNSSPLPVMLTSRFYLSIDDVESNLCSWKRTYAHSWAQSRAEKTLKSANDASTLDTLLHSMLRVQTIIGAKTCVLLRRRITWETYCWHM